MRVYIDIDDVKTKDIHDLYVHVVTNDKRAITVGGGMKAWCVDSKDETMIANGKPLSEVLAEIKEEVKRMEYHMIDCDVLVSQEEVLDIINKHISGEGTRNDLR